MKIMMVRIHRLIMVLMLPMLVMTPLIALIILIFIMTSSRRTETRSENWSRRQTKTTSSRCWVAKIAITGMTVTTSLPWMKLKRKFYYFVFRLCITCLKLQKHIFVYSTSKNEDLPSECVEELISPFASALLLNSVLEEFARLSLCLLNI